MLGIDHWTTYNGETTGPILTSFNATDQISTSAAGFLQEAWAATFRENHWLMSEDPF